MTRVEELRQRASSLSAREIACVAAHLRESLPPVLDDDDEGVAEALRRDEEMERNPSSAITWDELRRRLGW